MKNAFTMVGTEQCTENSRKSLVSSRKFNNEDLKLFRHSELGSESIPHRKLTVLAGKILKQSWIMRLCPKAWFWASFGFRFAHPTANPLQDDSYDNFHNEPLTLHPSRFTRVAFTMAEILLSLTIIGVVAAITLPSLTGNINERTWNTQRKALYARFSQAIMLMPALNGYGTLDATDSHNVAETFVTNGLSKVLKINNICDNSHLSDCGLPAKIITMGGSTITTPSTLGALNDTLVGVMSTAVDSIDMPNTKAVAFETQNGESILTFYQPKCIGSLGETSLGGGAGIFIANKVCANFVYDLNGKKGPNTVGKDIGFITTLYPSDVKVVAPMPSINPLSGTYAIKPSDSSALSASKACTQYDPEYRLPNVDEISSIVVNRRLIMGEDTHTLGQGIWSSSPINGTPNRNWFGGSGILDGGSTAQQRAVWCIKR